MQHSRKDRAPGLNKGPTYFNAIASICMGRLLSANRHGSLLHVLLKLCSEPGTCTRGPAMKCIFLALPRSCLSYRCLHLVMLFQWLAYDGATGSCPSNFLIKEESWPLHCLFYSQCLTSFFPRAFHSLACGFGMMGSCDATLP